MSVKSRIIQFIEYLGITVAQFERDCGLSNGYVRNISKSIQPDKTQKISNAFPDLNTGWLLTGEGEMLKSEKIQTSSEEIDLYKKLIASLEDTVSSQKIIIQKLQTEIIRLQRAALYKPGLGRRRAASATPPDAEPI